VGISEQGKAAHQDPNPSQTLFAGVEKLIYEVRCIPDAARQQMLDKQLRHILMLVELERHLD
jgi:hypothetical protein